MQAVADSVFSETQVPRLARAIRLRHDRVRQRWVLLGPERGFVLNETGAVVVRAFAEGRPLGQLAAMLVARFGAPTAAARDQIVAFVRELHRRGLVDRPDGQPDEQPDGQP